MPTRSVLTMVMNSARRPPLQLKALHQMLLDGEQELIDGTRHDASRLLWPLPADSRPAIARPTHATRSTRSTRHHTNADSKGSLSHSVKHADPPTE